MEQALDVARLSEMFGMSKKTIYVVCRTKGSPAYKAGTGRTSHWVCFPSEMKAFLQKLSAPFKG